jgi:hypothetical protein
MWILPACLATGLGTLPFWNSSPEVRQPQA